MCRASGSSFPPMKHTHARALIALIIVAALGGLVGAQGSKNPRFGKWKIRQDAAPPASNIMTYEPWGDGGMKVTVDAVNGEGRKTSWT